MLVKTTGFDHIEKQWEMGMQSRAEMMKTLRSYTKQNAGMGDCHSALSEAAGDLERAKAILDQRGFVQPLHGLPGIVTQMPSDAPDGWSYVFTKVDRYLRLGADKYRKADAYKMPDVAWDEDVLREIICCFEQFLRGKGYLVHNPIENVSIEGVYAALKTLHFNMVSQKVTMADQTQNGKTEFLDQILFKHAILGQSICLFNKGALH